MPSKLVLALGISVAGATTPTCKNDKGSSVDFSYSFKYPRHWEYAYMDSEHKLAKSPHTLDSTSSALSKTMEQIHESGVSHLAWNDQSPPNKDSSAPRAHSKGMLIFNKEGGVWITHSLPHFPTITSGKVSFKDAASTVGQTFLCITVSAAEIEKLAPGFMITRPVVYSSKFASGTEEKFKGIYELTASRPKWNDETMTKSISIKSKKGKAFTWYLKSGDWGRGKDLYADYVAKEIGSLYMEGWRRGHGVWNAACGRDQVLDVTAVKFPGMSWDTTSDHSKWAVTEKGSHFCVGDINRADGQDERGGGTVCVEDSKFASQMRDVIDKTDHCRKEAAEVIV